MVPTCFNIFYSFRLAPSTRIHSYNSNVVLSGILKAFKSVAQHFIAIGNVVVPH